MGSDAVEGNVGISLLDAVRIGLENDPRIQIQAARLKGSAGSALSAQGTFDITWSGSLRGGETRQSTSDGEGEYGETRSQTVYAGQQISKQFGPGTVAKIAAEVSGSEDVSVGADAEPVNQGAISFVLVQPLLRNAGMAAGTARLRAAELAYEKALLDYQAVVEERILAAVQAYWDYAGALNRLETLKASEQNARISLERTQLLIAGGEVPAAELAQMQANLESYRVTRIAGEQTSAALRRTLAEVIGFDVSAADQIPVPSDELDQITADQIPELGRRSAYIAQAERYRADLEGARIQVKRQEVLLAAAENQVLPEVNLEVSVGYSGTEEGAGLDHFAGALSRHTAGPGVEGALVYSWPTFSREARGEVAIQEALLQELRLEKANLERTIGLNIDELLTALRMGQEQLRAEAALCRYYRIAVENEQKTYQLGNSTLFNINTYKDRLTSAVIARQNTQRQLAVNIARLRQATGRLISQEDGQFLITEEQLTTLPKIDLTGYTP